MKKLFSLSIVVLFLTTACDRFKVSETASGLKFQSHIKNNGLKPKVGDIITFHAVLKTSLDSVLKDTYKEGSPMVMQLQTSTFKGSYEDGLAMMAVGDSATLFIPADSLFRPQFQQQVPPGVLPGTDLRFILKMVKFQSKEEFQHEQNENKTNEPKIIADYVGKNLVGASKTASGIYFKKATITQGQSIAAGNEAVVHYTGKFFNGQVFDSSVPRGETFKFVVGAGMVIKGWDEALLLMKKGEKGIFVIPSNLAYGPDGMQGAIPPHSPLVFEIELVDINKK